MSDIERIPVDLWRNPDQVNRVAAGTIPIGDDYEITEAVERHSFESFQGETENYDYWGDAPTPQRKRGRPRKGS